MAQVQLEAAAGQHHAGPKIHVTAHVSGHPIQTFEIGAAATLLDVMQRAAQLAGVALLPPRQETFDLLHAMNGEHVGPVIENLHVTLREYLGHGDHVAHFTVELLRTFHVNNRWDVAPKEQMTPREILALPRIHLDPSKYTLYLPEDPNELPVDVAIKVERGTDLEAQADGKYGGQ